MSKNWNNLSIQLKKSKLEKFWEKVDIQGEDECWEWLAYRNPKGYGQHSFQGISHQAHRLSWKLTYGEIPEGLCVCHHCDNPPCCNPRHLFIGTNQDNVDDKVRKNRTSRLFGKDNGRSKLTECDVNEIKRLHSSGKYLQRELGDMFGVSSTQIGYIVNGKSWKHV